jgi:hypothetical protein
MTERGPPRFLILDHLLSHDFLPDDGSDEILVMLPLDAASTIAVAAISCFHPNGDLPTITSRAKFEWIMQVAAYGLTLPTLFHDSLTSCLAIFDFWLTHDVLGEGDSVRNVYARKQLHHLSTIFDWRRDGGRIAPRVRLIHLLLGNLDRFQRDCASWLEPATFDVLVRIILGVSDFLLGLKEPAVLQRLFQLLFNTLCTSQLRGSEIWALFSKYAKLWTEHLPFVVSWREKLFEVFDAMCFGRGSELSGFQLRQFVDAIDTGRLIRNDSAFSELGLLAEQLFKSCQRCSRIQNSLFFPLYPIQIFFQLFGSWVFTGYRREPLSGHGHILRTLFTMIGSSYFPGDSPWVPVVMQYVNDALKSRSLSIQMSALKTGNSLLNRFYSDALCRQFAALAAWPFPENVEPDFWVNFSVLLTVLSERLPVKSAVIKTFIQRSTSLNAVIDVLVIVLKQNPDEFGRYASELYESNSPCVETLNHVLASYLPFIMPSEMNSLLLKALECANRSRANICVCKSFLNLVLQFSKFDDQCLEIVPQVVAFLELLYREQGPDQLRMYCLVKRLCGRPQTGVRNEARTIKLCLLVADRSLITLLDDDSVEVRDSRGRFVWRLEELHRREVLSFDPFVSQLIPPPKQIDVRPVNVDGILSDRVQEIVTKIQAIPAWPPSFEQPANHHQQSYMRLLSEAKGARNFLIDFIVQSGLARMARRIDEPIGNILAKFDAITDVKVIDVPLVHLTEQGIAHSDSQYFAKLRAILQRRHHLGLFELQFVKKEDHDDPVIVIFNETPFEINFGEFVTKARIAIVLQIFDAKRFLMQAIALDQKLRFWSNLEAKRIIHHGQVLATICAFVFRFYLTKYDHFVFEKDQERAHLLSAVRATDLAMLESVRKDIFVPKSEDSE